MALAVLQEYLDGLGFVLFPRTNVPKAHAAADYGTIACVFQMLQHLLRHFLLAETHLQDRIVAIVQKQRGASDAGMSTASATNKVKRGDIRHAIVVRTRKQIQRKDGSVVKFDDNACVLINKSGDPVGTRVNGVVGAELRRKQWSKILSMAPMHA